EDNKVTPSKSKDEPKNVREPGKNANAKTPKPKAENGKAPTKGNNEKNDAKNDAKNKNEKPKDEKGKVPDDKAKEPKQVDKPKNDDDMEQECYECWTRNRSLLSACNGITEQEFLEFNKQQTSRKVASCLCVFADNIQKIFDNACSAVCPDEKIEADLSDKAIQFKKSFKCDGNGNSILGNSTMNKFGASGTYSSDVSKKIIVNNLYIASSFVLGIILGLS
ncbi:10282_t:CDS:1, partial [Funneliformis mosseae]